MTTEDTLEIQIINDIGWGFDLKSLLSQAEGFTGSKVRVPINSFGGSVVEGFAIYNTLIGMQAKFEVETSVVGYAISAASYILQAGAVRTMPKIGAYIMIHEPWTYDAGDSQELAHTSKLLDSMGNEISRAYAKNSNLNAKEWRQLMQDETWLTPREALKMGLVDKLTEGVAIQPKPSKEMIDRFGMLNNVPQQVVNSLGLGTKIIIDNNKNIEDMGFFQKVKNLLITDDSAPVNTPTAPAVATVAEVVPTAPLAEPVAPVATPTAVAPVQTPTAATPTPTPVAVAPTTDVQALVASNTQEVANLKKDYEESMTDIVNVTNNTDKKVDKISADMGQIVSMFKQMQEGAAKNAANITELAKAQGKQISVPSGLNLIPSNGLGGNPTVSEPKPAENTVIPMPKSWMKGAKI